MFPGFVCESCGIGCSENDPELKTAMPPIMILQADLVPANYTGVEMPSMQLGITKDYPWLCVCL